MTHGLVGAASDGASAGSCDMARRRFEMGRTVWSHIRLEFESFEPYFARHAVLKESPREAYAADMYLACACACGVPEALRELERTIVRDVARAAASIDATPARVEDTLQTLREQLLVPRGAAQAKITEYGGRASLRSWLCAVAVRAAISSMRRMGEKRHASYSEDADRRLAAHGPEFEYLRRRYRGAFEDAVRIAVQRLSARERMLLRLNLVDGMSIDGLGAAYKVGRSTAARWLADARRSLFEHAHQELRTRLRLTTSEFASLATDIRSQLEVSLCELLQTRSRAGP